MTRQSLLVNACFSSRTQLHDHFAREAPLDPAAITERFQRLASPPGSDLTRTARLPPGSCPSGRLPPSAQDVARCLARFVTTQCLFLDG